MSAPHRLSPTWPTPRVRDGSPPILAVLALAHLAATATANLLFVGGDQVGRWVLVVAGSAAAATVAWVGLSVRLDVGRPGWKRLPRFARVDPDSLPRRPLRWRWLLWYGPLWAVVTVGSLLLTPGVDDPVVDLVLVAMASGLVQLIAVLLAVVALGFLLMPPVLVVIGCRRLGDGDGLPPTGPVLIATGTALLLAVPWAVAMTTVTSGAPWGDGAGVWSGVAVATSAVLLVSVVTLAAYGLHVRDHGERQAAAARD